jgi:acyl-CoA thioester hydrolase
MPENPQRISVRVYYEDTDFSGRVYHASYFRFFERGRTEWLRGFGFQHNLLAQSSGLAFAVTKLQADFVAPAFIDDLLEIVTELSGFRGPVINFRQVVNREGARLVIGSVDVVAIKNNRAVRPPRDILNALPSAARRSDAPSP